LNSRSTLTEESSRIKALRGKMEKVLGKELVRRVKHLCGSSVDLVDINNEKNLSVLDACLRHERQWRRRITMIRALKARIRKLEKPGTVNRELSTGAKRL
jgi:DNA-binding HxlR family transcriptional regulator